MEEEEELVQMNVNKKRKGDKQFPCDECEKEYVHQKDLTRHKNLQHSQPRASKRRRTESPAAASNIQFQENINITRFENS